MTHFVAPGDSLVILGLRYTLVALFLDVWSPHGIVSLFSSAYKNFGGGIDVTPFLKQKLNVAR